MASIAVRVGVVSSGQGLDYMLALEFSLGLGVKLRFDFQ